MINIDIDRIKVALYGVSAQVVESAAAGLEAELKRRLGVLPRGDMAAFDMGELAIGPVHQEAVLDAASLRGIIAEHIMQAIRSQATADALPTFRSPTREGGG